ncbi:class I SAM-dependent methyltransferase [Salmonirosea aquatica]|uniref:Methyltransferase domain-containing protein n=1 Tax=Salmonirosea aquatica TaxID=2654236 RepID=A0A7C9FYZ6_9BACT|nr:methyltransferase domain-containing protein [Cytophagaceae bacterium SJW1-29]
MTPHLSESLHATKDAILYDLRDAPATLRGMFLKNWLRYRASVHYVLKALPDPNQKRLLDYGCGHPFMTRILTDLGYTITGYEPYATEAEWQTARWLGVEDRYTTQLQADQAYDLVLMIDVIEHLSVIKPIMIEINQLTAPDGYLVLSTPNVMRIEMWLLFVRRRTGHPQPLRHFLESNDNFTHHQREFTQAELRQTARHFGYKVLLSACQSTRDPKALRDYHALLTGLNETPSPKSTLYNAVVDFLYRWFPNSLANNLFLIGQKPATL